MTDRSRRIAALAVCLSCFGSPLAGQTTGTLDLGASIIDYVGYLPSGAAVLSSALRHDAPNLSLASAGSWTVFESGSQILQATAAGAWLNSLDASPWGLELAGALGAAKYADEAASGHVLGSTRVHLFGGRSGAWVGLMSGASLGDSVRVPLEIAATAWSLQDDLTLIGTIAATRLPRYRHLEVLGTARWTRQPLEVEARLGARPWEDSGDGAETAGTGLYGDISLLVSLSERLSIALSGGSYPSDPVRRLLAASSVNAAIRVRFVGSDAPSPAAIIASARNRVTESSSGARLEIAPDGQPRALRVHAPTAEWVELMGDFTDWQPVALSQTHGGTWEILLPLAPGVHRLNIRLDGGPWIVPAGTRPEQSDFGGAVGVIVVN